MMKFLTDENIYPQMVKAIRCLSYDVLDIKEQNLFGISDNDLIKMAHDTGRILITFDKDFSNIIMYPPCKYHGIIVLRLSKMIIENAVNHLIEFIKNLSAEQIDGRLAILEPDRVRFR